MKIKNPFRKNVLPQTDEDIKNVKTEFDLPLSLWFVIYYGKAQRFFYKRGIDLNGTILLLLILATGFSAMWLLSWFS